MKLRRVQTELFNDDMRRPAGQALVEFALALPVILLLVFGVLEIGRAFQIKIVMENAAREGAHYFIYDQDDASNNFTNTIKAVKSETLNSGVTLEDADIIVQCWDGGTLKGNVCQSGDTIEVITSTEFQVAVFSYFLGPITMQSNARMLVP